MQNQTTPTPQKFKLNKRLLTLFGFTLSGIALYFVLRGNFDLDAFLKHMGRIKTIPLILSVVFYWGGVQVIRSFLVRHLLRSVGEVRPQVAYRYICIGFLVNNVLPLRMGEGARIGGIAKRSKISVASTAGGLVVERLMDLTMAALIGLIAIQLAPIPDNLRLAILLAGGGLLVVLIILGFIARRDLKETRSKRYGRLVRFFWNIIARFAAGFGGLGNAKNIIITFILAAAVWGGAVGTLILRLMAFDLEPDLATALVLMAGISLGISLPSAPSGVGVYHWLAAQALIIMGFQEPMALSFAFFTHFVDFASSSALGTVCMIMEGVGFSDLKASRQENNQNNPAEAGC